jgi:murein DD-endopeptidase MepM/ murein hydrolase activator NlpD
VAYTIKRGDTLYGIAKANNTTIDKLLKLNPSIKNPNLIYAGNTLNLPAAKPAVPVVESAPVVTPKTATTSTPKAPDITGMVGLGDYGKGAGLTIGWTRETGPTVNGNPIDTTGLVMKDNKWYGTPEQISKIYAPYMQAPIDLSGLNNFNISTPGVTPGVTPAYVSPFESKINDALDKILNYAPAQYTDPYADEISALLNKAMNYDMNAPYDVTTSPLYNPLKQQYDEAGQTAFNNQIGRLSALTGGRPSTAAVGTATAAQNQYARDFSANVLPSLINQEMARRQNIFNNMMSQLSELQGISNAAYGRNRDYTQDVRNNSLYQLEALQGVDNTSYGRYRDTISDTRAAEERNLQRELATLGQYSKDYAAEANRRQATPDASDDYLIPYLRAASNEKAAALEAAKAKAEQEAREYGLEERYTNAQIENMRADNARAAANAAKGSTGIESMGTPTQVGNYYYLLNVYANDEKFRDKPLDAYNWLVSHAQDIVAQVGPKLYKQLVSDVNNMMKVNKTYGEKPEKYNFESDAGFQADLAGIYSHKDTALQIVESNVDKLIEKYGVDGYNALLTAARAVAPKQSTNSYNQFIQGR